MSFTADLDRFIRNTQRRADQVYRGIALDMFSKIMLRTPVGNPAYWVMTAPPGYVGGRLRANWQITIGSPATGELNTTDWRSSMTGLSSELSTVRARDVVYFTNNLPYAERIEHGYSVRQAPHGMVKITVQAFDRAVSRAIRI
ncbi:MAG: HK97 gp10 family phage protein [Pseudomonadales bacterium]|nr:HK97 gp10 family phage protein [Pseudomonadales bacterium]